MDTPSSKAPPKRKRHEHISLSTVDFSFDPARAEPTDDGSSSPRSKVAHRFRGLGLGGGGGVVIDEADDGDGPGCARKRQRLDEMMTDAGQQRLRQGAGSPTPQPSQALCPEPKAGAGHVAAQIPTPADAAPGGPGQDTKSPHRRRAGTPPLKLHKSPKKPRQGDVNVAGSPVADEDDVVVDPVRAALTWHEDEITIYDPNDKDDDGTGINGVGFKPTPAIAEARAIRRRHQMAEYRRREEKEARAKRSQLRGGEKPLPARLKNKSPARKVRFVDSERRNGAVTTPCSTI
ncbi:uncharacterized protein MAM_04772 [Metarhizium album ARSEF 1941]|uniref:Uncharacterized protein n=1 Tax=Metarhizium album (strain ARSEF 1941) TaxID=1081103 RepID=A0A0B2WWB3_METAS|nr:uncharacterized protein MAM_04772 [Metarhizium album ARSEF 1941]KHN97175.1 hypothetical protein MAM_04772 [Metarhizium album ARSEF 1941]